MNDYLSLLAVPVRDVVTGFEGVVSSISFDAFGCVQVLVTPRAKDGKLEDQQWFDFKRLVPTGEKRVLNPPSFGIGTETCWPIFGHSA